MEDLKAIEIKAKYPEKLCDRWLEAGFRAWTKRQLPRVSKTSTKEIEAKLKDLDPVKLRKLINWIKTGR